MQAHIGRPAAHFVAPIPHRSFACKHSRLNRPAAGQSDTEAAVTVRIPNPEGSPFEATWSIPAGCTTYTVSLKKPLGFTLTESDGCILVESVVQGGNAAAAGVRAGDVLLATTGRAQTGSGMQQVLLKTQGQSFKTVSAGLRSNTCAQCPVSLVLQRREM